MGSPDQALQAWFDSLPAALTADLAPVVEREAENLAAAMRARVRRKSGALADTIKVRRRRSAIDLEVVAGGDPTIKEVDAWGSAEYDYALAIEYGTTLMPAYPFFWSTAREMMDGMQQRISESAAAAIGRHTGSSIGGALTLANFGTIIGSAVVETFKPPSLPAPIIELNLLDGIWR